VRQNILFGKPYDADHYARVVQACALEDDFAQAGLRWRQTRQYLSNFFLHFS
jgi:hypothetical protein